MVTASIAHLKATLSRYIRKVKAGEEVLITERGKTVAKLVPAPSMLRDDIPEYLLEMEKEGLVRIGKKMDWKAFWKLPRPEVPGNAGVQAVLDERAEGR